ncbi:CYTH and CHAD domain-containing protein [Nocardioides sp. P86]|uniref:CYTH and CHAD domain-containing protein n=1 Tax=Nocardioides sp. P86 TaxID=2939569 RepID=UPI00203EB87C|nr:CYTH and CHAD domain-containing protein [Nocardioides sp. P86]MCM3515202.1 CYTH and CHAD domain-containing protein [Nocardioides sp. P86]
MAHHEIERTYSPPPQAPVPDLTELPGVAQVGPPVVTDLEAAYVDTPDLRLVRAGISLRRRTGGTDAGWHLKLPVGEGRDELRRPLTTGTTPPQQLRALVAARVGEEPLVVVATVLTRRTTQELLHADGAVLAELVDDEVTGSPGPGLAGETSPGAVTVWREWELELVTAGTDLLEAADEHLAELGVEVAAVSRKIEVVLGEALARAATAPGRPGRGKPAGRLVGLRLQQQVEELLRRETEIRRGGDRGVHQARVACRRIRSALATYRPLLDREVTEPVRAELRWLAGELGGARDAEVVHDLLRQRVVDLPAEQVVGPVRSRLRSTYGASRRADVVAVLDSPRCRALWPVLQELAARPPLAEGAQLPARKVAVPRVDRDVARVEKAVERVVDGLDRLARSDDDPAGVEVRREVEEAWHDARKAAKRLRYAAEVLEPAWGKRARRLTRTAKAITQRLGERQDTEITRRHLLDLARAATAAGESAFTYGVLHAREQARAEELETAFLDAWPRTRSRLRKQARALA